MHPAWITRECQFSTAPISAVCGIKYGANLALRFSIRKLCGIMACVRMTFVGRRHETSYAPECLRQWPRRSPATKTGSMFKLYNVSADDEVVDALVNVGDYVQTQQTQARGEK